MIIKIDASAAASFEQAATTRHGSLTGAAQEARAALEAVGLSTQAASLIEQIAGHVQTIGHEFGAASRRAVSADVFTFTPTNLVLTDRPSIPATDAAAAEAIADAEEYAEWMLTEPGTGQTKEEIAKTNEIAQFLEKHKNDPDVLAAFYNTLGPEGVTRVPDRLAHLGSGAYPTGDGDTPRDIREAQQRFMEAFGTGLANASRHEVLQDDFAKDLAECVTDTSYTEAWALSETLRYGDYPEWFLIPIANELDEHERSSNQPGMWQSRMPIPGGLGSTVPSYTLGTGGETQYYDPFVGLFEAMGRTPDAALKFLYPAGIYPEGHYPPGKSRRAVYYIKERTWSHDDFDALGQMLEGAALAHRTHDDPRATWSALAATDAVNLLGARKGSQKIGDGAYDSLGNILSSYIVDVDRAYEKNRTTSSAGGITDFGDRFENLPPGAAFERSALEDVLAETLTDGDALNKVLEAVGVLNSNRIAGAIDSVKKGDDVADALMADATTRGAQLTGVIIGAAGYGNIEDAKRDDARAKIINDFLKDVANAVPIPGSKFVDFVAGQAIDKIKVAPDGYEGEATDENWEFNKTAAETAFLATGTQLSEAGLLKQTDKDGKRYDWYVWERDAQTGDFKLVFDPVLALNKDNYAKFYDSLKHDPKWGETLGSIKGSVNDGVVDGMQGS